MIYYSNSKLDKPHMTFIGRWSPFHKGHTAIMNVKRSEHPNLPILIMVRNTKEDIYPPTIRAEYIKIWMQNNAIKGTIMIVPNIEGVYWGRGVGYNVGLIDVDMSVQKISGTRIRKQMSKKISTWKQEVATQHASYMLSRDISTIIDRGLVIWLTGCPSSGKTTIANALIQKLNAMYPYLKTQLLDGDDMRSSPLAAHVGFTKKNRAEHVIRMAYLAKMFADHGILVICAFVSPDRAVREEAQKMVGKNRFLEVYVLASQQTRMRRDTKGLYKKAKSGKIKNFTGFNAVYEAPKNPSIICDTDHAASDDCVRTILDYIFK